MGSVGSSDLSAFHSWPLFFHFWCVARLGRGTPRARFCFSLTLRRAREGKVGGGAGKSQRLHFSPQALPYLGVPSSRDVLVGMLNCISDLSASVSLLWILDLLAARPAILTILKLERRDTEETPGKASAPTSSTLTNIEPCKSNSYCTGGAPVRCYFCPRTCVERI